MKDEFSDANFNDLDKFAVLEIVGQDTYSPENFLAMLKTNSFLKRQFERDSGVFEGYTLERHTLMALAQFERYFARQFPTFGVSRRFFRIFLALHDIGKPIAALTGDKSRQHDVSIKIIPRVMESLGLPLKEIRLALALVSGDAIGKFLRGRKNANEAAKKIRTQAHGSGLSDKDFFALLTIYYQCDAGSYTADAGGIASLDYLFRFDHDADKLQFAPDVEERFAELVRNFHE